MTAMLPAHLTESLNNLGDVARALTEEVRADRARQEERAIADREQRRRETRRMAALLVVVAVLVVFLAALSVSNRRLGNGNRALQRQNQQVIQQISDCTSPGGGCYERNQARTGDAIGQIVRAQIYAAECAKRTDTDAELERCVAAKLAAAASRPPTATPTPTASPR